MKRESRLLYAKAVDSLVLSIEHHNRPWDRGRVDAVLILLDHAFEMLLKAAILHRGGAIRKPREKQTIGFDECLRKALSDGAVQFLKQEQVLQLQAINTLRDAAQHHLVDLSEQHLYIHAQAGLTLFRDVVRAVFDQDLQVHLPPRVLPLSTTPPTDLATLFEQDPPDLEEGGDPDPARAGRHSRRQRRGGSQGGLARLLQPRPGSSCGAPWAVGTQDHGADPPREDQGRRGLLSPDHDRQGVLRSLLAEGDRTAARSEEDGGHESGLGRLPKWTAPEGNSVKESAQPLPPARRRFKPYPSYKDSGVE